MREFLIVAVTLFTRTIFGMAAYFRLCEAQQLPLLPCLGGVLPAWMRCRP